MGPARVENDQPLGYGLRLRQSVPGQWCSCGIGSVTMTKLNKLFLSLFVLAGLAGSAIAQTALTQTTLSQAPTVSATSVIVASATGISAPSVTAGNPATV